MILIADSGATKTTWAAVWPNGRSELFSSSGCNPNYTGGREMSGSISKALPENVRPEEVTDVYFYCAGITEDGAANIRLMLNELFPGAGRIECESDLIGTARAILGRRQEKGLVAILGTGSNSGFFEGEKLTEHVDCMGFILGDEGSGAYIGKRYLQDFLRKNMPQDVYAAARDEELLDRDDIIAHVYRGPRPSRYCASFCKVIAARMEESPYYRNLVKDSFRAFFREVICRYDNYREYPLGCTGSIAYVFANELREVAAEFGTCIGMIMKKPIHGLVEYHCNIQD